MAIKVLNLTDTWFFQSKYDPDKGNEDKASIFEIKPLDSRVYGKLRDKATKMRIRPDDKEEGAETTIAQNDVNFEICQFGLAGWMNILDEKGEQVECELQSKTMGGSTRSYRVVKESCIERLPRAVIQELAQEIMRQNELEDEEGKD